MLLPIEHLAEDALRLERLRALRRPLRLVCLSQRWPLPRTEPGRSLCTSASLCPTFALHLLGTLQVLFGPMAPALAASLTHAIVIHPSMTRISALACAAPANGIASAWHGRCLGPQRRRVMVCKSGARRRDAEEDPGVSSAAPLPPVPSRFVVRLAGHAISTDSMAGHPTPRATQT